MELIKTPRLKTTYTADVYRLANDWLTEEGYNIIYSNHPSSEIRHFDFTKNRVRIRVFIDTIQLTSHCVVLCDLPFSTGGHPYKIMSCELNIGDKAVIESAKWAERTVEAMHTPIKPKRQAEAYLKVNQTAWETWFIVSIVIFFAYFFVGTLPHSVEHYPNWLPFMIGSVINLLVCIYYGTRKH